MATRQTQLFCSNIPTDAGKPVTGNQASANPVLFKGPYSYSRLSLFENCPLCYNYKYITKPEHVPPLLTIEAFMGSRVHESLEYLYNQIFYSPESDIGIQDLLCYYKVLWNRKMSDDVKIIKEGMTEEDYLKQGEQILKEYFELHAPFSEDTTLFETDRFNKEKPFLEKRVDFMIGDYKMMGFIDRVAKKKDGTIIIHDYKTSGNLPTEETLQKDRQLALYRIALDEKYPDTPKELNYHFLRFSKTFSFTKSDEEIEQLKRDILGLIKKIEIATEEGIFPAIVTSRCAWCEFAAICPEKLKNDEEKQEQE